MDLTECDRNDLGPDEACLVARIRDDQDYDSSLYSVSSDCVLCPYARLSRIQPGRNTSLRFAVAKSMTWRVYNDSGAQEFRSTKDESDLICQFQPHNLGENGIYRLTIGDEGCQFDSILEPRNLYTPLVVVFGCLLGFLLAVSLARLCLNVLRKTCQADGASRSDAHCTGADDDNVKIGGAKRRVLSIDTFRGMSILTMIFVNNGAGGYAFLEHATWNGLLVGDLVFPSFVWIMGVCIPLSLSSQLARGTSRSSICLGILKRSALLFLLDLSLNTATTDDLNLKNLRIFGVLQRFAVAYFVVGTSYAVLGPREATTRSEHRSSQLPTDRRSLGSNGMAIFVPLVPQWIVVLAITALHCGATFFLPVPGCPTGYLGPGGRHADGAHWNCTGGAAGYIDRILLGENHLYQHPSVSKVYGTGPFDPEGILGCLTTILQTFLGVAAGNILRVHGKWTERVVGWLVLALVCGCLGSALHFTDTIPVNKNLWSLSFVFTTTSFALALFTATYLLVDVARLWGGGPFRIPGTNALVMYVGHRICYRMFPFHWQYGEPRMSHAWQTIAAVWDVVAWTIVAYILHRKRIYVSV